MWEVEFPWAGADGVEVADPVEEQCFVWRFYIWLAGHKRPNVFAVDFMVGELGVDEFSDSGEDVDCHGRFITDDAFGDFIRPTHDAWLALS